MVVLFKPNIGCDFLLSETMVSKMDTFTYRRNKKELQVMRLLWDDRAWDDYLYWQTQDKKTLKRINALIKDIQRDRYDGIGKPEPLKENMAGWWSRRIDELGYRSCWYEGHITDDDRIGDKIAKKKSFDERAWFNGFNGKE